MGNKYVRVGRRIIDTDAETDEDDENVDPTKEQSGKEAQNYVASMR